jgi:hypothetical protein
VITSAIAIASEFGLRLARGTGGIPKQFFFATRFGALLGKQFPHGSVAARNDEIGQASVFGRIPGMRDLESDVWLVIVASVAITRATTVGSRTGHCPSHRGGYDRSGVLDKSSAITSVN